MVEQFGLLVRRAYACLQFRRIVHICRIEIPDLGNVPFASVAKHHMQQSGCSVAFCGSPHVERKPLTSPFWYSRDDVMLHFWAGLGTAILVTFRKSEFANIHDSPRDSKSFSPQYGRQVTRR